MAILVDNGGRDLITLRQLEQQEALAKQQAAAEPPPQPVPEPAPTGRIELPAMVDRRPAASIPIMKEGPPPVAPKPADPEQLDAVYTANGGQLGTVAEGYAKGAGALPVAPLPETLPDTSTPQSRLAVDGINGARGAAASGLFTAAYGAAMPGANIGATEVAAAVIAQGVDDIAAGAARSPVVGGAMKFAAKIGPIAAASTIIANLNAVAQEKTPQAATQAIVHASLDIGALAGAAALGTAVGGPLGAAAGIVGFTAYQIMGGPIKENFTKLINGEQNLTTTLANSWTGAASNAKDFCNSVGNAIGGWFSGK